MLKFRMYVLGLYPVISAQITFEICVAAWNRKKVTENVGKSLSSACYNRQQVRVYLQPFSRWTS